jgi:hypothetical protein
MNLLGSRTAIPVGHVKRMRLLLGVVFMSVPAAGLAVVALAVLSQVIPLKYGLKEFSLIVFTSIILTIFVHEAAHIIAAGKTHPVTSVSTSLLIPHINLNIPYTDTPEQRRDAIRILAAGSAGNFVLAMIFLAVIFFCEGTLIHMFAQFMIICNFLSIVVNLTPFTFGGSGTDGLQILHLLRLENRR